MKLRRNSQLLLLYVIPLTEIANLTAQAYRAKCSGEYVSGIISTINDESPASDMNLYFYFCFGYIGGDTTERPFIGTFLLFIILWGTLF